MAYSPALARFLVLLVLLLTWLACKEKPQGAKIVPHEEKAPERTLTASTEPWQDLLKASNGLALQNGALFADGALRLTSRSSVKVPVSATQPNGAIRAIGLYEPAVDGLVLVARMQESGARYELSVKSEDVVRLAHILGNGQEIPLKDFALQPPLKPAKPYELELRVQGDLLTARLNGALLGSVRQNSLSSGTIGVRLDVADPVLISQLQYLPLGSGPASEEALEAANAANQAGAANSKADPKVPESGAVTTENKPGSEPGAAAMAENAAPIAPLPKTGEWVDAVTDSALLSRAPGLQKAGDGTVVIKDLVPLLSQPIRDGAVRATTGNGLNGNLRLAVRRSATGQYLLNYNAIRGFMVRIGEGNTRGGAMLMEFPLPPEMAETKEMTLELRAVGSKISVLLNGEVLREAEDTRFSEGQLVAGPEGRTGSSSSAVKVKKLEFVNLDPEK